MKVTLTEKGLEFRNSLLLEATMLSPTETINISQPHKSITTSRSKRDIPDEVLDSLLPALISAHPPQTVRIKQPQVTLSHQFMNKYPTPSNKNPNTSSMPSLPLKSFRGLSRNFLLSGAKLGLTSSRTNPVLKSFYSTFNANNTRPSGMKISDNAVSLIIASTLKTRKMKEKQLEVAKRRNQLDLKRHELLTRIRLSENAQLEMNTRSLEDDKIFEKLVLRPKTDRERYKARIERKHEEILKCWKHKQRSNLLAVNPQRLCKIPFTKLHFKQSSGELLN